MRILKRLGIGLLVGSALVTAVAAEDGMPPIKIGVIGPYSGGSAPMGASMLQAVRLAVSEINWKGGLLGGRPLQLVERDDEANPDRGEAVARELVEKDKVDAVLGIANTGVGLRAIPHFQKARIPIIVNMAAGAPITAQFGPPQTPDSYVFRLAANDSIQTVRLVTEATERLKLTKLAVLGDSTPYGRQGVDNLKRAMNERGIKPVFEGSFDVGQTDMHGLIAQARTAGAQALLVWGIGPELAAIAKARAKDSWKVPLLGSWTLSLDNFIQTAGKAGDGARMIQTFIAEPITPRQQEFLIAYKKQSGLDRIPSAVSAAQGYDSMLILAAAMKQANAPTGLALRNALENLQTPVFGVVTTYEKPFSHTDHEAITTDLVVTGEIRDGRITYAHKEEISGVIVGRRRSSR